MSQLEDMRIFAETVDAQSFTAAAERLGLSKQFVSKRIAALETRLGARLLLRSTRRLRVTDLGLAYHERAQRILQDVDAAEQLITSQTAAPRGLLRLSAPMTFATLHLGPLIPLFMQRHPEVSVELELNDRTVDLIGEGYDMAVRIGTLADSSLIARRITTVQLITCASPEYLRKHGTPAKPEQLSTHACLIYGHARHGEWSFRVGERARKVSVSGPLRANNGEMLRDAALTGLGIINLPDFIVAAALADGRLVPVLDAFQPEGFTVHAVYPQHRQASLLVRSFSDFLVEQFRSADA
ncbi:LysR substrate-binding domain-containing protein [Rhodanobacter sp. AS-Z3]|uniref:LysR family transcriptional regulator n=1 Tax=Rhodanobacter sp. AS-Z3 TaxID=3031330 RepID=UPI0024799204|nr:LysR family transcriptional regulator [Rhodanobacter sp. AS-Z3]WEN14236.1 LysR substrate-binding domain-containing protein [Rhodanobacter sp. AS-Z3]